LKSRKDRVSDQIFEKADSKTTEFTIMHETK
jgi:hypothetical protein